jgi:hypothetical protein
VAVEWIQKKTRLQKREDRVHGSATKKIETYCCSEIFFLEILINIKAGGVNWGTRGVYHGRRVGQAFCRVCDLSLFMFRYIFSARRSVSVRRQQGMKTLILVNVYWFLLYLKTRLNPQVVLRNWEKPRERPVIIWFLRAEMWNRDHPHMEHKRNVRFCTADCADSARFLSSRF